jgi:hypothetical protein
MQTTPISGLPKFNTLIGQMEIEKQKKIGTGRCPVLTFP